MQLIRSLAACLLLLTTGTVPALAQDAASLIALSERLQGEAEARGDMLEAGSTIAAEPEDAFFADTARFSSGMRALALHIDTHGGPADLPCIFRGMAEDADMRRTALEADPASAEDYRQLARTFSHAAIIAADVETEGPDTGFPPSCPSAG
ncbi:hypothetical protein GCM10007420_19480 [Glycocaulis albus]|jgi:hypothetical protein|uniref:Uncharacterized protein n=1 Tax=Glycocaulis albus TaxID=1382801 RepID=A0ABQ1XU38_9PROT|nr:hypothetical protein [Glycocaulis albus]MBV5258856.1 hypothetical protein [Synechococcus moorigangaii CMS01]GGH03247.1 hypothetical protein GCM10007420_19480 [Glycocaulis albus]